MKITQIRNATQCIEFGGVRFLIDPMLCKKGSLPGFPGTLKRRLSSLGGLMENLAVHWFPKPYRFERSI